MSPERLSALADEAVKRYQIAVSAMDSAIMSATFDAQVTSKKLRRETLARLHQIAQDAAENETARAIAHSQVIANGAILDAEDQLRKPVQDNDLDEFAESRARSLGMELGAQLNRDANAAYAWLTRYQLKVAALMRGKGYSATAAAIAVRSMMHKPQYTFRDRLGRKWEGRNFVSVVVRAHYLNLYNDVLVALGQLAGVEVAYVKHVDPDHDTHGHRFKIGLESKASLHDYERIRMLWFHPNSRAVVALVM